MKLMQNRSNLGMDESEAIFRLTREQQVPII